MQPIPRRMRVLVVLLGSMLDASAWAQAPRARVDSSSSHVITTTPDSAEMVADADVRMRPASNRAAGDFGRGQQGRDHATAVPWSQLSNDQRDLLAPLKSQWDRLPPRRQQRLAVHAQDWAQLPPARRQMIGERLQHWAQMSPQQRQAAARGAHAFRKLPDADRQRLMETYQRFQALPPEQQRALMQQWRAQHPKRRGMRESPMR